MYSVSEFNEFEPPLKSAKNRFQLSAGLNLETLSRRSNSLNSASDTATVTFLVVYNHFYKLQNMERY